jgi:hypothetical protein
MALGKDDTRKRGESVIETANFTGRIYNRVYVTDAATASALTAPGAALAPGIAMPATWYPDGFTVPATTIATPRLQSATIKSGNDNIAGVQIACSFVAFDLATSIANSYATLTAYRAISENQFEVIYEGWGIAATTGATLPAIGSAAAAATATLTAALLFEQQSIITYHGRLLVRNLYRAFKLGATISGYKATILVEAS